MTIWKKAISAATSAALLASLLATAVAPGAFAAITIGSAGNVPMGGTSANEVSFSFSETAIASLGNAAGSSYMDVTICDFSGFAVVPACANPGTLSLTGTPSVAGSTGSLGASATLLGNVLRISIGGSDLANKETILVSGLKIKATSLATAGAISMQITAATNNFGTTPALAAAVFSGGGTATGYLVNPIAAASTSAVVAVTSGITTCPFTSGGTLVFATNPDGAVALTTASAINTPLAGQQTLTIGATANAHLANEVVSQATACTASPILASPGTVVAALKYSSADNATVYPGEFNSPASNLTLVEPSLGFLAKDSTFTFTIKTAGVVFSTAPTITATAPLTVPPPPPPVILPVYNGGAVLSAPVISADRLSATVTVTTASTAASTFVLSGILYDVAATVAPGTFISVGVTTSAGKAVQPATNTNAVVFRGVLAVSATTPTVYIGENNQTAGVVSFTESAAGFFTAGVGTGVNTFQICPSGVTYAFTLAPYAAVVGGVAAGNVILRDGSSASTTNIVQGTNLGNGCYGWTVWTASTTASTIKIGNAALASGALINVTAAQAPGGVNVVLKIGSADFVNLTTAATVQFATAAYRNQVAVTALSQPAIAPGATNAAAGDLQIAETGLGQLKAGENVCVEVLWRSGELQDQFLNGLNTADLPLAAASGTGLVISPVNYSQSRCAGNENVTVPVGYMESFTFQVLQQSTKGDGKIVISNIRYTTLTDSAEGPVQLSVWGFGGSPTNVIFHSTVTNAVIGTKPAIRISAVSALGVPPNQGPASTSTKVAKANTFITWRFAGGSALAGKTVRIYVSMKNAAGGYGPYQDLTGRVADASGNAFFSWRATAKWASVRAYFAGDNSYAASWSAVTQGRWL